MAETFRTEAGFAEYGKELAVLKSFGARFDDREQISRWNRAESRFIAKLYRWMIPVQCPAQQINRCLCKIVSTAGGIVEQTKVTGLTSKMVAGAYNNNLPQMMVLAV